MHNPHTLTHHRDIQAWVSTATACRPSRAFRPLRRGSPRLTIQFGSAPRRPARRASTTACAPCRGRRGLPSSTGRTSRSRCRRQRIRVRRAQGPRLAGAIRAGTGAGPRGLAGNPEAAMPKTLTDSQRNPPMGGSARRAPMSMDVPDGTGDYPHPAQHHLRPARPQCRRQRGPRSGDRLRAHRLGRLARRARPAGPRDPVRDERPVRSTTTSSSSPATATDATTSAR